MLGADAIVTGSITELSEYLDINTRLIGTERSNVLAIADVILSKTKNVTILMGQSIESQSSESKGIQIISATYGGNCGATNGNVTEQVAAYCNGKSSFTYVIDYRILGDPAYMCKKNFIVEWKCGNHTKVHRKEVPPEAGLRKKVILNCGS